MAGIYVHVPFCSRFCTYCNFYSVKGAGYREQYIQSLESEMEFRKEFFKNKGVSPQTIYFGGGTPSLFPARVLERLLHRIIRTFDASPEDISIEVNPNDITEEYAAALRRAGFNRVSMGVQSFVDEHLLWMNRRHRAAEGEEAFHNLRAAGFNNISLDLIFGYGGLTEELWQYNLEKITSLSPEHISAYQMSIEPGSALGKMYERGEYDPVPDETCRNQYAALQDCLGRSGYTQYEISSFARRNPGGELLKSRHNSSYWTKEPYLGLGPAAHSYDGETRFWNHPSVVKYCRCYLGKKGNISPEDLAKAGDSEKLQGRDIFNESVMLGLRTVEGADTSLLDAGMLREAMPEIRRHIRLGNLIQDGVKIKIPSERLFVSDGIIRDLFI